MANDFSRNPYFLDTVMANPTHDWVWIKEIAWTDFGTADSLIIKDASGGTILDTKTTASNTENYQKFSVDGRFHGIQLTALTAGGKVIIYIK